MESSEVRRKIKAVTDAKFKGVRSLVADLELISGELLGSLELLIQADREKYEKTNAEKLMGTILLAAESCKMTKADIDAKFNGVRSLVADLELISGELLGSLELSGSAAEAETELADSLVGLKDMNEYQDGLIKDLMAINGDLLKELKFRGANGASRLVLKKGGGDGAWRQQMRFWE
jgi:hypothetical protein